LHPCLIVFRFIEYLAGTSNNWGWQGVGEKVGPGLLSEQVNKFLGTSGVPSSSTSQSFAKSGIDDVHTAVNSKKLLGTPENICSILQKKKAF